MPTDLYIQKLNEAQLSNTASRRLIFECLYDNGHRPMSLPELAQKLHRRVNRASIYRNIETFEKAGIIKRVHIGWKYKIELSEDFYGHHHHLVCDTCGKITNITLKGIESELSAIAKNQGYVLESHHLSLHGMCLDCQAHAQAHLETSLNAGADLRAPLRHQDSMNLVP
jgi:Fur family transcriptional regulator, ferric uptake regulator